MPAVELCPDCGKPALRLNMKCGTHKQAPLSWTEVEDMRNIRNEVHGLLVKLRASYEEDVTQDITFVTTHAMIQCVKIVEQTVDAAHLAHLLGQREAYQVLSASVQAMLERIQVMLNATYEEVGID